MDLIKRLQEAEAGSRELDDAIWWPLVCDGVHKRIGANGGREENVMAFFGGEDWRLLGPYSRAPAYTTSLDAIVALIGEKLPGYEWSVGYDMEVGKFNGATNAIETFWGATAPLALCIALLAALREHGEKA